MKVASFVGKGINSKKVKAMYKLLFHLSPAFVMLSFMVAALAAIPGMLLGLIPFLFLAFCGISVSEPITVTFMCTTSFISFAGVLCLMLGLFGGLLGFFKN